MIGFLSLHLLPLRNGSLHLRQKISLPLSLQERGDHIDRDVRINGEAYDLAKLLAQQRLRDCVAGALVFFDLIFGHLIWYLGFGSCLANFHFYLILIQTFIGEKGQNDLTKV